MTWMHPLPESVKRRNRRARRINAGFNVATLIGVVVIIGHVAGGLLRAGCGAC